MKNKSILALALILGLGLPAGLYAAEAGKIYQREQKPAAVEPARPSAPTNAQSETDELNSLALGDVRQEVEGEPLRIPQNAENMDYLAGAWSFDRLLKSAEGDDLRMDFAFNRGGEGAVILRDSKDNMFVADASAQNDNGALKIATGEFINPKTGQKLPPELIECRNAPQGAECRVVDGKSLWQGEHLLGQKPGKAALFAEEALDKRFPGMAKPKAPETAVMPDDKKLVDEFMPGPEAAPDIMNNTSKADSSKGGLAALEGDWLYSRELASQGNGKPAALGFKFDGNGKGESVIKDSQGKEYKASAEAQIMPNGALRVKTEAYDNGAGEGFYPTFMECKENPAKELACDVSNGWMRMTDGRLLNQASYRAALEKSGQGADVTKTAESEKAAREERGKSIEEMMTDFPGTAQPPVASNEPPVGPAMTIPDKNSTSMDFLAGKWRCNTGLVRSNDNEPVVVEFSFNNQGQGTASVREKSGVVYNASASANLRNGVLRINTSDFRSPNNRGGYHKTFVECRDEGNAAICNGENGGIKWSGATFTRLR